MKISFFFREGRAKPFEARWYVERKQKARFFGSAEERDKWARKFGRDLARNGARGLGADPKRMEKWQAAAALLPDDVDPIEVARFFIEHRQGRRGLRLGEAVRDFLWHVEEQTASRERLTRYERTLNRLAAALGDPTMAAITPAMLHRFVFSLPMSARSRKNHRSDISAFFRHFVRLEEIASNPVKGVPVPEFRSVEAPGTLDAGVVAELFRINEDDREACALLALCCFAGMRSSAAGRVELADVRIGDRGLYTPAVKTKKERRQFLQGFPDNLWPWLERAPAGAFASPFPESRDRGEIERWKTYNKRRFEHIRNRALRRAGLLVEAKAARETPGLRVTAPPHNWGRHSFVSYHVAIHKDPGRTAYLISHKDDPQVLYDSYLGERSEAEARVFFGIVPGAKNSPNVGK